MYPNPGYGTTPRPLVNYLTGKPFITVYGNRSDSLSPTERDTPFNHDRRGDGRCPLWEGTLSLQVKGLVKQSR